MFLIEVHRKIFLFYFISYNQLVFSRKFSDQIKAKNSNKLNHVSEYLDICICIAIRPRGSIG